MPRVVDNSVQLIFHSYDDTTPGVSFTRRGEIDMAVLHLSRHSRPIVRGYRVDTPAEFAAIRITGNVTVEAASEDDIASNWQLHLIQFFHLVDQTAFYAGRNSSEGRMVLDFAAPPALPRGFLLDADSDDTSYFPYVSKPARIMCSGQQWKVSVEMYDHPFCDLPLKLPNFAVGNKSNYLYEAFREFQVVTALVARNVGSSGGLDILAHTFWSAMGQAQFRWSENTQGDIAVDPGRMITKWFTPGGMNKGAPLGSLAKMIANPSDDEEATYNRAAKRAFAATVGSSGNNPNVTATDRWLPNQVPPDHFG